MDIQKLRYFYEVAKFQHVTKAAESIAIAQPALTQAIKSLEAELGVALFHKKGRNIYLTEFGEHLKKKLDILLPEFDSIYSEMEQLKTQVNKTVRLNILAASNFVINAIIRYRRHHHDDVVFDFEQNEFKRNCDIVISTNGLQSSTTQKSVKRSVLEEKIFLAVPKTSKYSELKSIDLRMVKNEEFVMLSSSRLFGAVCNEFCSTAGFTPKIMFESDSPIAVQNIVSTGTGIAFWPQYSWGNIKNKDVVMLPISYPECKRELIIELFEHTPKSEYAEDFYEYLLRKYKSHSLM